ncbi:hypothetical protein VTP01DRAFT_1870 [Rhizomucor pusillus]|uniref:uncharacterized protein n=1 Tax=Rhizomucor pusillus TaxID=4840 RepID=UPI003742EA4D
MPARRLLTFPCQNEHNEGPGNLHVFLREFHGGKRKALQKKLEELGEAEICWNADRRQPVVVHKLRIKGDPFTYKKYLDTTETNDCSSSAAAQNSATYSSTKDGAHEEMLQTEAQAKQFLNEAYFVDDPLNDKVYSFRSVGMQEIFNNLTCFTNVFNNRSLLSFTKWCSTHRLPFMNAIETRKLNIRKRDLYVMREGYQKNLARAITQYLMNYQYSIRALKSENYEIVGYARKSPGNENAQTRTRLLQKMIRILEDRSLATKIFVSPSCISSEPFNSRDNSLDKTAMTGLKNVAGNTQDLLHYAQATKTNICLAAIDFAGLTTNVEDLKKLLSTNNRIKKVAVDTFSSTNELFIFDSDNLIRDSNLIQKFQNRKSAIRRSI